MRFLKKFLIIYFAFFLLIGNTFLTCDKAYGAFDVKGVQLSKDNNICINKASSGTVNIDILDLSTLQSNQESIQSRISSGGSLCTVPPFFAGGALLTTANGVKIQADPIVQGLGRGILISEIAGNSSGVSSSGDPSGFNALISSLGGLGTSIFEITLPAGCDVIDDKDDIAGASTDLSTVNAFSLPTCTSTNGLTVQCNAASGLLTAINGLVPATGSAPAKIRFVISAIDAVADSNMIDSILVRLDSQDIFCPGTINSSLTATVIAKNAVDNATISQTLGTADLGSPTQAAKINYATDTVTSLKGEVSTNEVSTTPLLLGGLITIANKIQIEELDNQSIPIGGLSSPLLINPPTSSTNENNVINLWLIPSYLTLFSSPPLSSDITISDDSIVVNSAPYIVMSNSDDLNAPFGSLVIPLRKNSVGTAPQTVKTKITVSNISLNAPTASTKDATVSLVFFEPTSGAIVNTPGGLSVNNSTSLTNPQNFSSFSASSTRALAQNSVISTVVNEGTGAAQITTDADLNALTIRDATLGTPQINGFTKVVSKVTDLDSAKITVSSGANNNSTQFPITVKGEANASIPGAKVRIDTFLNGETSIFDTVTITSKSDGSFTASLRGDSENGNVTVKLKQIISGTETAEITKTVLVSCASEAGCFPTATLECVKELCECTDQTCTPTVETVLNYIKNNGGLAAIVTAGGTKLSSVIKATKKAFGLS